METVIIKLSYSQYQQTALLLSWKLKKMSNTTIRLILDITLYVRAYMAYRMSVIVSCSVVHLCSSMTSGDRCIGSAAATFCKRYGNILKFHEISRNLLLLDNLLFERKTPLTLLWHCGNFTTVVMEIPKESWPFDFDLELAWSSTRVSSDITVTCSWEFSNNTLIGIYHRNRTSTVAVDPG